ncbi:MAG: pitrilysin family protein [Polyangia bacterium]
MTPPLTKKADKDKTKGRSPARTARAGTTAAKARAAVAKLVSEHAFGSAGLVARMYELPSGLRALLLRDPAAPVVAYQTWFRVGSRHERIGKTGIAHLFEHLMFNETENLPHGEFDRQFELEGGDTNASTWVDWTYYQDNLPASALPLAIRLEADRMQRLVVKKYQIETERGVVMSERRNAVEDDVDGFMSERLFRLAFKRHPYGRPTIGWMRDIKGLTLGDARRFYKTYYAPNNATIVVVGDIDEQATLKLIAEHYLGIPPQKVPKEKAVAESRQLRERRAVYKKPVMTDKLLIGYKSPALHDPDHLRLELLSDLLIGGLSSVIYRDLVIEKELCSTLGGSVMPFRDPGLWEIGASMQRGHRADEAIAVFDAHIERIREEGPDPAAVERSKARLLTGFYSGLRTAAGKATSLGEYETTVGDYTELFSLPEALRSATAAELREVARRYLAKTQRTIIIAEPDGSAGSEGGSDDGDEVHDD